MASLMSTTDSWRLLKAHAQEDEMPHLRELMADAKRCEKMFAAHDGITLDYSRQARADARAAAQSARAAAHGAHVRGRTTKKGTPETVATPAAAATAAARVRDARTRHCCAASRVCVARRAPGVRSCPR
jgi:hypothetical protein